MVKSRGQRTKRMVKMFWLMVPKAARGSRRQTRDTFYCIDVNVEHSSVIMFAAGRLVTACTVVQAVVKAILTIYTSYDVFPPKDVPFGGLVHTAPHFGGKIPQKPQFWGRE